MILTMQNVKQAKIEKPEPPATDLDQPRWSVISFDRCEASGLTYAVAVEKMAELDAAGSAGLCITTDEAAARLRT